METTKHSYEIKLRISIAKARLKSLFFTKPLFKIINNDYYFAGFNHQSVLIYRF